MLVCHAGELLEGGRSFLDPLANGFRHTVGQKQQLVFVGIKSVGQLQSKLLRGIADDVAFLREYGFSDEMETRITDEDITLYAPSRSVDIERLLSYSIGCMMVRYSLDEPVSSTTIWKENFMTGR